MIIKPYTPDDMRRLLEQPSQAYMRPFMDREDYRQSLQIPGMSFSAIHDGRVLGCAGIAPLWEGRAEAWAILSDDLKHNFVPIHRAVRRFLGAVNMRRIEAHVDVNFGCAKRWIEMLGFEYEGLLRAYTPDGRDCLRYARIK